MNVTTVTVDVEVDIDDIDTQDLLDALESRGHSPDGNLEDITEMFYAFKLGREDRAMELARKVAQEVTGRIL